MPADAQRRILIFNEAECESTGSGFIQNINFSNSLSNAGTPYVMVSWLGIYTNAAEKRLYKETDYSTDRYATVSKVGYGSG